VGNLFANRNVALISSFLLAISGFHILYSQEARAYTLLCLISTIVVGSIVKILQEKSSNLWIFLSSFFSVLLLYSHVYGSFLYLSLFFAMSVIFFAKINKTYPSIKKWLLLQQLSILWIFLFAFISVLFVYLRSPVYGIFLYISLFFAMSVIFFQKIQTNSHIKKWLYLQTITIILFIPAAIFLIKNYVYGISKDFWITKLSFTSIFYVLRGITFDSLYKTELIGLLLYIFLIIYFFTVLKKLKNKNFNILNALKENTFQKDFLLLTWFVGPLTIGIMISMLGSSILHQRYLICILPSLIIMTSIVIDKLSEKRIINSSFILIFTCLFFIKIYVTIADSYIYWRKDDNRSVVSAYKNFGSSNDCILFYHDFHGVALLYYLKSAPKCFLKINDLKINSPEIMAAEEKKETFWLMMTTDSGGKVEVIKDILNNFKSSGWKIFQHGSTNFPIYRITLE
jgi:hypothetical protein